MSLDSLRRGHKSSGAPLLVIYGPQGIGKTSAALSFPRPVIVPVEDGIPRYKPDGETAFEVDAFPPPTSYNEFISYVHAAASSEEHDTIVIDSLDRLEQLLWQHVCDVNDWGSIEDAGFGRGYVEAQKEWWQLMNMLREINKETGKFVVLIGHADVVTFNPPGMESYSQYVIRLNKKAGPMVTDEADAVLFMNDLVELKTTEGKFGSKSKHAEGGGSKILHAKNSPSHQAKNRLGMPEKTYVTPGKEVFPLIQEYMG